MPRTTRGIEELRKPPRILKLAETMPAWENAVDSVDSELGRPPKKPKVNSVSLVSLKTP